LIVLKIGVDDEELSRQAPLLAGILGYDAEIHNLEGVVSTMASQIISSYN